MVKAQKQRDATPGTCDQAKLKLSKDSHSQKKENPEKISQKDVSAVLDNFFFLLFCIILIAATTVYFGVVLDRKRVSMEGFLADYDF